MRLWGDSFLDPKKGFAHNLGSGVGGGCPPGKFLTAELLAFKVSISLKGHDSYGNDAGQWRENSHDDLVLAVALAAWYGVRCAHRDRRPQRRLVHPLQESYGSSARRSAEADTARRQKPARSMSEDVSTHKAALWLGLFEETVRRLCREGKLKGAIQSAGYQGRWLIPAETLEAIRACPKRLLGDLSKVA